MSPPNLISGSLLVTETIDYLISVGGRASASELVGFVMNIPNTEPDIAARLMGPIVASDLRLSGDGRDVVLTEEDHDEKDINAVSYVVFDLETTGTKAPPSRVMEIGAYKVFEGKIEGEFKTLVHPEMDIPAFVSNLTGIRNDMVRQAPKFQEVLPGLLSFIGDSVLVAHNAMFDLAFLNHEIGLVYSDAMIGNPWLCTVQLARRILPDADNHKLKTLADYYSVELINHHRAGDDAYATARIFIKLMESLTASGIIRLGSAMKFSRDRKHGRPRKAAA